MEFLNQYSGAFLGDAFWYFALGTALVLTTIGYLGLPLIVWTVALAVALVGFNAPVWLLGVFAVLAVVFNVPPIRAALVSSGVMKIMKALGIIPTISETERTALEAGVVWVEADLFSGRPDFKKILQEPWPKLSKEEEDFLSGPVEHLCGMIDEYQAWKKGDMELDAWEYIKKNRFLGMIIPKEYGGLGFSAYAHAQVIMKLASRSAPATITVMVPNSLGPAELLLHYGTNDQKNYYLPRLAKGEEIPCFALTEPGAGSDAGSISSDGVLFKGQDGKIYMRLNWNKRYITLAAVSTLLGLAFKLRDPENLLGRGENLGITCALIPTNTPGVVIGRRHDPLGVPFYNCPTQGKDVVISIDAIVGGAEGAGRGWGMLMECLAAGRGISLPGQSIGGAKLITRTVSAYASIRRQFGTPIGKFEGIEEPIARIAGLTYLIDAFRSFTLGALDKGLKPPVITAMAKYHSTELVRKICNDGMDVLGGAGISRGSRNILSYPYVAAPIAVTVEGANIMTRSLIIFGQGALRAHPYAFKEVKTLEKGDLKGFDQAFWGHIGHVVRNSFRAVVLSVTRGYVFPSPVGGSTARYYQKLAWSSATFAIMADIAMASLGGALKTKEKITGRFADALSYLYIGTSVLRRWEAEGRREEDLPFVHFSLNHSLNEIQKALDGIFANLPVPGLTWLFNGPIRWWSNLNSLSANVRDRHTHKIASLIQVDGDQRDRLTAGIHIPTNPKEALGRYEHAFKIIKRAEAAEKKIRGGVKAGKLPKKKIAQLYDEALKAGVITQDDFNDLKQATEVRNDAVQVDDFSQEEYTGRKVDDRPVQVRAPPAAARAN